MRLEHDITAKEEECSHVLSHEDMFSSSKETEVKFYFQIDYEDTSKKNY